jgi:hypothetical protein
MSAEPIYGIDDHEPGEEDSPGRPRCAACSYIWPCPTVRSQPRQLDVAERELLEVLEVGVGYYIERRLPGDAQDPNLKRGGLVVGEFVDDEDRRCFRVSYEWRRQLRRMVIRQDEIEPAAVGLPNSASIRHHARFLARLVAERKGAVAPEELEHLADAIDLLKTIG